jgi:7,8-dihydropterin-6-yl-methyl-4-(beta-D-ribofuranosyl)aminobenzene 5'-phosphate synthase
MKISVLVDDETQNNTVKSEHGLSFYIETLEEKILFDTGKSNLLMENAKILGIDLLQVTKVLISHGHYDHGGGLSNFLDFNQTAKVYIQKLAFKNRYSMQTNGTFKYIGLDPKLRNNSRLINPPKLLKLSSNIIIFNDVVNTEFYPSGNKRLFQQENNEMILDDFSDEQYLIIIQNEKVVLISGCSHRGILNIVSMAESLIHRPIDYVFGGFHFFSNSTNESEEISIIQSIGNRISKTNTKYFTMHCTGLGPYAILKEKLGNQISYLGTGGSVII